ncbi:MAG: hypothetical protein HY076_04035 [Candidatus Eisenbacteria bacterium]|uniref:DUF5683 domain-containing protein n=1 Tax=Eiseniibacteriota bacterium TaxID=2212470 RepID=A0A9D6QIJ0_UNCEI|nr:hypothetical protein [Candidatus Eisenbacteria bacterium]MBI3539422.1 hypothetical protein [Candidatus Eisenbacteria bacterium]
MHADTVRIVRHAAPAVDTIITLPALPPLPPALRDSIAAAGGIVPARSDSAGLGASRADSTSPPHRRSPRERREPSQVPTFDQPRWVMLRSLAVPGWGQFHNHAWIKGVLIAAGDGLLRFALVRDERRLGQLNRSAIARLGDLNAAAGDTTAAGVAYRAALAGGDPQQIAAAQAALNAADVRAREASDVYNQAASVYNALLDSSTSRRWLLGGVVIYALLDAYVDAHFRTFDVDFRVDPALPSGSGGASGPDLRMSVRWSF